MNTLAQLDWNAIYLTCFGLGLALSVLAFLGGFTHLHIGHLKLGLHHGHAGRALGRGAQMTPVNGFSIVAFLCWFGGTGALLTHGRVLPWPLVMVFALLSGVAGAALIYWFLAKVLLAREKTLEPEDTEMAGVIGRVSATVPPGGMGEMLYSQNGSRRATPIRAENNETIPRDAEVIVMRYHRGCAYVRRWAEFEHSLLGGEPMTRNTD
jgi:membrane protein implicated in regulation of membrane protease activity